MNAEKEIPAVTLEGVTIDEQGNYIANKADGSGTVVITPEQLEEGMVSFGKDITSDEMLYSLGGVFNKPIQEAIYEYRQSPENNEFLHNCNSITYNYETTVRVRHQVKENGVVTSKVQEVPQEESISYDSKVPTIDANHAKKLVRRIANLIEAKVVMTVNEGILGFTIERIAPGAISVSIKRTESSRYTFQLGI